MPVWALGQFPSQDGPSHVYNAWVQLRLDAPDAPYAAVYERSAGLVPNLLGGLTLAALGRVVPLAVAERLLISLCVVLFCWGFARLARGERERLPAVALLGPVFASAYPLHMGFYGYCLGIALVPLAWAEAWRRRDGRGWQAPILLGLLALVAWFAHLVAAGMILIGVAIIAAERAASRRDVRPLVRYGLPLLPAAALSVWYVATAESVNPERWSAIELLGAWASLRGLVSYAGLQGLVAWCVAVLLLGVVVRRLLVERSGDAAPWLLIAAAAAVVYAVVPDGNQRHWFLSERLSLLVWLPLVPLARLERWERGQALLAGGLALVFLVAAAPHQRRIDAELTSMRACVASVEPGARVLSLVFRDPLRVEPARARPFLHAFGRLAVGRDLIDVGNYEARTDHFQLRVREGVRFPPPLLIELAPGQVDLRRYGGVRTVLTRDLERHAPVYRHHLEACGFRQVSGAGRYALFAR